MIKKACILNPPRHQRVRQQQTPQLAAASNRSRSSSSIHLHLADLVRRAYEDANPILRSN